MSKPETYVIDLEGVGQFEVFRLTQRQRLRVLTEQARLTEGVEDLPESLLREAAITAAVKALVVKAPDGWDVDSIDPLDADGSYSAMQRLYAAIAEREQRFRGKTAAQGAGPGAAQGGGLVVAPAVQPAAD